MPKRREDKYPDNGFEAWGGYMHAKIAKLEEQFCNRTEEGKESNLFEGISIYVNGYTKPSANELKTIMSKHGGVYHTYQRSEDFIVATNLPDTKVKRLTTAKIVKPEWITDSLAANKVLDYKQYLLYSKHTRSQPRLQFNTKHQSLQNKIRDDNSCERVNEQSIEIETESKNYDLKISENIFEESSENERNTVTEDITHTPPKCNQTSLSKEVTSMRTAADPQFLSEYYSNSRLHHISQLGATFKQYVNDLREASDFMFPARNQLKEAIDNIEHPNELDIKVKDFKGGKLIMHIDMDCFFVSVGLRTRPELRGEPVAVTHARGRGREGAGRSGVDVATEFNMYRQRSAKALSKATGISKDIILEDKAASSRVNNVSEEEAYGSMSEIASCSYEARAKGVRNGMFMGAALRLCPDLKTIPYDFDGYKEVAYTLYNTIAQYTLDVEAVSCDELYADCTELASSLNVSVPRLARVLRRQIQEKTRCPCSAGFGGNRLQARMATKRAKPDGQFFLTAPLVDAFMLDVPVADLPGVGRQLLQRVCAACGGERDVTCAALRPLPLPALQRHLGVAAGKLMYHYCRGDDTRPLTFHTVRKSVSAEVNYGIRLSTEEESARLLRQLCVEVHERMRRCAAAAKCLTVKIMVRAADAPVETAKFMGHGFCDTINKNYTFPSATEDLEVITRKVLNLLNKMKIEPKEMRGVGIQLSKLESLQNKRSNNALTAFLTKACSKTESGIAEINKSGMQQITIDMKKDIKPDDMISGNTLMSWVTKTTPTKHFGTNSNSVTPVKNSPPPIRSPVKSPQKSPQKKRTLGLTGRRRGRPSKTLTHLQQTRPASRLVMQKFLSGERAHNNLETIDPEILAALPEDIRREVLEHYQPAVVRTASVTAATARHNTDSAAEWEPAAETLHRSQSTSVKKKDICEYSEHWQRRLEPSLLELPWQQTREMLRSWLSAGGAPLAGDIELMSSYMQNMVIARNIDKLQILINFLNRNIQEMEDASWLRAYNHIVEGIQQTMVAVYGKPLLLQ